MSAIGVLMSTKGVLMSGQFLNDFSGHYVPHSAHTSLGPMFFEYMDYTNEMESSLSLWEPVNSSPNQHEKFH